jgi:four helix bundle protein
MNANEIKRRTKAFALEIIRLVERLPKSRTAEIMGKQLIRWGTSVGANYRAVCRAKSSKNFIFKKGIVEEEADEAIYWLELLGEAGVIDINECQPILNEANQILSIVVASIRTARANATNGEGD